MVKNNADLDQCDIFCSDPEKVSEVKRRLHGISLETELFKALSDETRFKLVYALWQEELCVCDLALALDLPIAAVSYHLRYLRSLKLVKAKKKGKMVFYKLADQRAASMVNLSLEFTTANFKPGGDVSKNNDTRND